MQKAFGALQLKSIHVQTSRQISLNALDSLCSVLRDGLTLLVTNERHCQVAHDKKDHCKAVDDDCVFILVCIFNIIILQYFKGPIASYSHISLEESNL